jgi:hypothetical protein
MTQFTVAPVIALAAGVVAVSGVLFWYFGGRTAG